MQDSEKYVDRETGTTYGDARALVNAFIERFSRKVSEASSAEVRFSPLDEDGYTSVGRGSATIGINVLEEQGLLLFLARIMEISSSRREELYRRLLELNYLATSDGAFAIEKETDTVYLRALRGVSGLDYDEFEDMLHTVAAVADEWDDRLREEFGGE
ncbi:MAG: YbjN domain-containing protein [Polyangia bacterium]